MLALAALVAAQSALAGRAAAQRPGSDSASRSSPDSVVVTPGAQYEAGWFHRFLLGADYRDVWTAPIKVEVLDLARTAGGLRPTERGGSMQTNSLRMAGADGREYVFRPLEKDFTKGLPPELRETLVRDIVQDQVAGYHPGAPLVVSRLLDATGLHHVKPRFVVMPDDPALGEFRADFAGVIGTFEERPDDDFDETDTSPGALNVVSSERLFERMRKSPDDRVNARAFLAARLFDVLVGDRDRHRDQWRWGKFADAKPTIWEPIPRDRDMPFSKFEGVGPWVARGRAPQLVSFGEKYPAMEWLNWNGREVDRRLLSGLEWAVWDSVTRVLQSQMTRQVIEDAIAQMPPPFVERNGRELAEALVVRRDKLPEAAREFYQWLATEVNLEATDQRELAEVTRNPDGSTEVAVTALGASGDAARPRGAPLFRRRFEPRETREVRLYLFGGNDRVVIRGAARGRILVRVVSGDGDDQVVDSVSGGDRNFLVHDEAGNDTVASPSGTRVDRTPYVPPKTPRPETVLRDWGEWTFYLPGVSYSTGVGLLVGVGRSSTHYAFRRHPYASQSLTRLDVSLTERRPRLTYAADYVLGSHAPGATLQLTASGIDLIRFHGFGNETPSDHTTEFYRVFQNLFRVEPGLAFRRDSFTSLSLGVRGQYTATRDAAATLVGATDPYGSGEFGQVGATVGLAIDRSDIENAPTKGFRVNAGASIHPPVWDVERAFGEVHAVASTYLSAPLPLQPTLALRAGGQHVWGSFPFHAAATLGGASTLRGWDEQRFAGRSALYGGAELRLFVAKTSAVVPADFGILGFADAGRVVADDLASDRWHSAVGGGLWFAPLTRDNTVSVSVAWSRERRGVYVHSGFAF